MIGVNVGVPVPREPFSSEVYMVQKVNLDHMT